MKKPEHWEKIKEIVGEALERDPSHRTAFLNEVCSGDDQLRAERRTTSIESSRSLSLVEKTW